MSGNSPNSRRRGGVLDLDPPYRPVEYRDGYPRLEDLGLIGDGTTAALVSLDGSIPWLCVPGFDGDAVLCGLLDRERGGQFRVRAEGLREARQRYVPDTGLLVTELRTGTGLLRVTDALAIRAGADLSDDAPANRSELVRSVVVIDGEVRVHVELDLRDGGLAHPA